MNCFQSKGWLSLGIICAANLFLQSAWAHEDGDAEGQSMSRLGIGAGVMSAKKPYRNFNNKTEVLPLITYENKWVRVLGPSVAFKLPSAGPMSFNLNASYDSEDGYKPSDSPFLVGMDKRKASAWVGASASWRSDIATVTAGLVGDASGESKGQQLKFSLEKSFRFGAVELEPRIAVTWLDNKYVNYYYGVKKTEARTGRSQYDGKSTVNTELAVRSSYALAPNQTLALDVGVTVLGSSIKDSPLVDRSTVPAVRVFYLYRF